MKIRKIIRDWLNRDLYAHPCPTPDVKITGLSGGAFQEPNLQNDKRIRLTIYPASGGKIIETTKYDSVKDRIFTNLYIITSDENFGDEIEKILTLEHLR